MPSFLIMVVSWMSFLIPFELLAPRTTLCITAVLTTTTMWMSIDRQLPPASYVKAIDVWKSFCLISVYSALFEYGIVNFFHRIAGEVEKVNPKFYTPHHRPSVVRFGENVLSTVDKVRQRRKTVDIESTMTTKDQINDMLRQNKANNKSDAILYRRYFLNFV